MMKQFKLAIVTVAFALLFSVPGTEAQQNNQLKNNGRNGNPGSGIDTITIQASQGVGAPGQVEKRGVAEPCHAKSTAQEREQNISSFITIPSHSIAAW